MRSIFLIITLVALSINATSQEQPFERGHVNERGHFEYNDYEAMLDFLDYARKLHIDGDAYFYFETVDKTTGKRNKIVLTIKSEYVTKNVKFFSDLKDGLLVDAPIPALKNNIVNEKIYKKIEKLSDDVFYHRYVRKNGVLKEDSNWEIQKAVLFRILKSNIIIGQGDVSGEWSIGSSQ